MALPEVYYQQLGPEHKSELISITRECFPGTNYPDSWYDDLLGNGSYAHGAFDKATDRMVGMISAYTQSILDAEDELETLLESVISVEANTVAYIPIFGESLRLNHQLFM